MDRLETVSTQDSNNSVSTEEPTKTSPDKHTVKHLSPSIAAWSEAALRAGERGHRDPEFAAEVGKRLY